MKKILALSLFAALACAVHADIVDDFNRADTSFSKDPSTSVGSGWYYGGKGTNAEYRIHNNTLDFGSGNISSEPGVLLHTGSDVPNLTLSVTMIQGHTAALGGLVWDYQNPTNYYYSRYEAGSKGVQVFRLIDGSQQRFVNQAATNFPAFTIGDPLKWTVTKTAAHTFDVTLEDINSGESFELTATDSNSHFDGGPAGLHGNQGNFNFDDFSVIPEPTTLSLLSICITGLLFLRRRL